MLEWVVIGCIILWLASLLAVIFGLVPLAR